MVSYNYKGVQWLNDVNTEEIESFNYIDLHLWRPLYQDLSVALKVHNLLDQDFADSRNMITPGRMANAQLKYSFKYRRPEKPLNRVKKHYLVTTLETGCSYRPGLFK